MCAKLVQKLRRHSELVEAGRRVHGSVYICVFSSKFVRVVLAHLSRAFSLVVLNPIGVQQREDQVGELAPLEFCDKLFVLLVGELASVVFEDSLRRLAGGRVKEHDRCHVFAKRLGNAGYLLGQYPHGDAVVPCAEAEIDQLARAAFHVLGGGAVVEHKERVGAHEEVAGQPQPGLDLMLQAGNHENVRIAVHEALVGRVLDKSGAEEYDVVKAPPKGPPQQGEKILCLARIRGPHDQGVEGQLFGVHMSKGG